MYDNEERYLDEKWQTAQQTLWQWNFDAKSHQLRRKYDLAGLNELFSQADQDTNKKILIETITKNLDDFSYEDIAELLASSENPKLYDLEKDALIEEVIRLNLEDKKC